MTPSSSPRTIWLTGCTSGLGKALVKEFSKRGHTVIGGARRESILVELRSDYPAQHFLALDVSSEESVKRFCQKAQELGGVPDLLINNAATINTQSPLWEVESDEFERVMQVNISGTAKMIRHTMPFLLDAGAGMIVNLSSGWGRSTSPMVAPYCASKWAIEGLTQALAQELPSGIAAVAMNPGIINTDMLSVAFGKQASVSNHL